MKLKINEGIKLFSSFWFDSKKIMYPFTPEDKLDPSLAMGFSRKKDSKI